MEQHDHGESGYTEAQARALVAKLTRDEKERLFLILQYMKDAETKPQKEMEEYNHVGKGGSY